MKREDPKVIDQRNRDQLRQALTDGGWLHRSGWDNRETPWIDKWYRGRGKAFQQLLIEWLEPGNGFEVFVADGGNDMEPLLRRLRERPG